MGGRAEINLTIRRSQILGNVQKTKYSTIDKKRPIGAIKLLIVGDIHIKFGPD